MQLIFLSALLISPAAESMHSPVWCCALLMEDQDTSLILLSGDLHSFGSPLNLTGKNLIPVTSSLSSGGKKKSRLALGKFSQQRSTEAHGFLLLLTACGLVLLYSRRRCKIWEIKMWGKGPQSYPESSRRQRIWVSQAIFIMPCYISDFLQISLLSYKFHSRH